ncbi:uncharacterized protein COLE_00901 [Cutaneotrichosporon oleaginosum]|uniref:uncharacterized protein n=1 Tax=Cutaneotrichosporon oleaginosum TaxID=879819 RepID=UPI0013243934|nr:hypothetical protein COLE_00901 [Cutaneotrichosporon oleaginosum]
MGADEINTSLLATQAALDCERLAVVSWDEAERWKKELSVVMGNLRAAEAKYNRELKFLAMSQKVAHLDSSTTSKRDSTSQSLALLQERVDMAEKELHPVREREAALRRRLNEHYAGVLARELRHLQRRENQTSRQPSEPARALEHEEEISRLTDRIDALEEQLAEAGRREQVLESNQRALEQNATTFDGAVAQFSKDREEWLNERDEILLKERDNLVKERESLAKEREGFVMERDARDLEQQSFVSRHETSTSLTRALHERIGASLGALLGRPPVAEEDMASAIDEAAAQMARRDRDIARLREEIEDIVAANEGADADFKRVSSERDEWKSVAETAKREAAVATAAQRSTQDEHMELVRKMRTQNTEISELRQRLELTGAEGTPISSPELVIKVAKLETELATVNEVLAKAWSVLPAPAAAGDAGLSDPRIVSPNSYINFAALQRAYAGPPASDKYPGIDQLLDRIRSVVSDGRILVERMANLEKDKERHKANASKAAKLVGNSQQALETYKRQVDHLEEQLDANQLALESYQHQVAELQDQMAHRSATAASENSDLERALAGLRDAQQRTSQLSAELAAKTTALTHLQTEVETLRTQASRMEQENEDERRRFQEQHMVILDEMNLAQEQNDALRTKLRAANASTTSVNRAK